MGRSGQEPRAGSAAQSTWHRDRQADIQGVPRAPRLSALAARVQRRRPAATPAVGQHGHEGPAASDILYIRALAAPVTVNTMPEGTLKALADHGAPGAMLPAHGGEGEEV